MTKGSLGGRPSKIQQRDTAKDLKDKGWQKVINHNQKVILDRLQMVEDKIDRLIEDRKSLVKFVNDQFGSKFIPKYGD